MPYDRLAVAEKFKTYAQQNPEQARELLAEWRTTPSRTKRDAIFFNKLEDIIIDVYLGMNTMESLAVAKEATMKRIGRTRDSSKLQNIFKKESQIIEGYVRLGTENSLAQAEDLLKIQYRIHEDDPKARTKLAANASTVIQGLITLGTRESFAQAHKIFDSKATDVAKEEDSKRKKIAQEATQIIERYLTLNTLESLSAASRLLDWQSDYFWKDKARLDKMMQQSSQVVEALVALNNPRSFSKAQEQIEWQYKIASKNNRRGAYGATLKNVDRLVALKTPRSLAFAHSLLEQLQDVAQYPDIKVEAVNKGSQIVAACKEINTFPSLKTAQEVLDWQSDHVLEDSWRQHKVRRDIQGIFDASVALNTMDSIKLAFNILEGQWDRDELISGKVKEKSSVLLAACTEKGTRESLGLAWSIVEWEYGVIESYRGGPRKALADVDLVAGAYEKMQTTEALEVAQRILEWKRDHTSDNKDLEAINLKQTQLYEHIKKVKNARLADKFEQFLSNEVGFVASSTASPRRDAKPVV